MNPCPHPRDDAVVLRPPRPSDAAVLHSYTSTPGALDGTWLPLAPDDSLAACERLIVEANHAWTGAPAAATDPGLMVTTTSSDDPIGFVTVGPRGDGRIEVAYGVEPLSRLNGYATSAARLCGEWLASLPSVHRIELHIPVWHQASIRVALAAGYQPAGHIDNLVPATGETYRDYLFVWPLPHTQQRP